MRVAVVGSGFAGYHAARTLVDRGLQVTVIDAGETLPPDRTAIVEALAAMDPREWPAELRDEARSNSTVGGGSLPMRERPRDLLDTDRFGRPFGWTRVFVVDASVLPSLPATTTALNAMANATRIADTAPLSF